MAGGVGSQPVRSRPRGEAQRCVASEALASPASQLAGADGSQREPRILALVLDFSQRPGKQPQRGLAVSYTHLTLPTILRV